MKTSLKGKVERLYQSFWILFLVIFGLDFITTNVSVHVFGLTEGHTFLRDIVPISNPLMYLMFFFLVLFLSYGGTEYWRHKGIEAYGRKSYEIITLVAAMVPLAFAIALLPSVIDHLQGIMGAIS
jgi:hypothetical protein